MLKIDFSDYPHSASKKEIEVGGYWFTVTSDGAHGVNISVPIVPEFSYRFSGAYSTRFGVLTPSANETALGTFELMMQGVGCFIRYEMKTQQV